MGKESRSETQLDWRSQIEALPVSPVIIEKKLEEIPHGEGCPHCNGTMVRSLIPIQTHSLVGNINVTSEIPGYICATSDCDTQTLDVESSIQFMILARDIILTTGDTSTTNQLDASIAAGKQSLAMAGANNNRN